MNFKNFTQNGNRISKTLICDLHLAICLNKIKEVENIIEKVITIDPEFDINCITLIGNSSPLSFAIYKSNVEIVKLLLKYRCNANRTSKDHLSRIEPPLCSAVRIGNISIIETLLRSTTGLNVNQTDFFNQTPLWLAVKARRLDIVEMIITSENFTVNCDSFNLQKSSPVYLAAKYLNQGRRKIFELLVNSGMPLICSEDSFDGSSVLYWVAVVHKDSYFVSKLTDAGMTLSQFEKLEASELVSRRFPRCLKSSVCIFLRKQIILKTNKPLTLQNVSLIFPQLPGILIQKIVHLT